MTRNKEIVKRYKKVLSMTTVGNEFGLTRERVRQILVQEGMNVQQFRKSVAIKALQAVTGEKKKTYKQAKPDGIGFDSFRKLGNDLGVTPERKAKEGSALNFRLIKSLTNEWTTVKHNLKHPIGNAHNIATRAGIKVSVKTIDNKTIMLRKVS